MILIIDYKLKNLSNSWNCTLKSLKDSIKHLIMIFGVLIRIPISRGSKWCKKIWKAVSKRWVERTQKSWKSATLNWYKGFVYPSKIRKPAIRQVKLLFIQKYFVWMDWQFKRLLMPKSRSMDLRSPTRIRFIHYGRITVKISKNIRNGQTVFKCFKSTFF